MNFDLITGVFFFFLSVGIVCSALFIYWFIEDLVKKNKPNKKKIDKQYTDEEHFYANLLLMKNDLDADAFRTRKAMLDEALKHRRK